jgi:GAF domain-containing protein
MPAQPSSQFWESEDDESALERLERASSDVVFLSASGRVLSSSINLKKTFSNLMEIIIPVFADCCVVSLIDAQGEASRLALKHQHRDKDAILRLIDRRFPMRPDFTGGMPLAIKNRKAVLATRLNLANVEDPELSTLIREVGLRSYMALPLILENGKLIGAVWFGLSESPNRQFTQDDLSLAAQLTQIAAQAIHNSSKHEAAIDKIDKFELERQIREDFIRKQVHDVKTPLTAAALQLQLAHRPGFSGEKVQNLAEMARTNIYRVVDIINNLIPKTEEKP